MSEGYDDFVARRHAENCEVVLERLEGKSLTKCLQKFGLILASQNGYKKAPLQSKCPSKTDKSMKRTRRRRKNSELCVQRNKNKRKLIKPLYYTDEENNSENEESFTVQRKPTTDQRVESQIFLKDDDSSLHKSETLTSVKTESEKVFHHENLTTGKTSPANSNKAERKMPESEVEVQNKSVWKHSEKSSFCNIENTSGISGDNDGEVEIIRVLSAPASGKTNCDDRRPAEMSPTGRLAANGESILKQELWEDEYDSREDSEDDKNTVIFEEEFHKDTDLEELFEEKEFYSKKFNNREITNRKRQRLVKFRKKSMAGRNLALIRAKTKVAEGASNEQETGEKPVQCVSEECLTEVCGLVERLHELYRIILQLKKELPKNTELAFHFMRVINAQQENFHKEIRKSQKTIIKCYEKMLSFYSDTSLVARVISKRTSLSVEDIVNVISRCILIEGQCETDETAAGYHEKGLDSMHKTNSENLTTKTSQSECPLKQQMINNSVHLLPYIPSNFLHENHRPKLIHRPSSELRTASASLPVEKTPASSVSWAKEPLSAYNGHQVMRKNKTHTRVQQNARPSSYFKERRPGQLLQSEPNQMSPRTLGIVARHFRPKPTESHLAYVNSQYSVGTSVQSVRPHIYRDGSNYTTHAFQQESPPVEPSAAGSEGISNKVSPVSVVLPAVQNVSEYNRHQNHKLQNGQNSDSLIEVTGSLRSSGFLSVKNLNGPMAYSHHQSITPNVARFPLGTILTDSVRSSDHKRLFVKSVELYGRNCSFNSLTELENSASQDVQEVLDPTIPQKLTMRNYRLQAGPVLVLEGEGAKKLNPPQSITEERKSYAESRNLDREDSKSRVYVCAQNDCKNPGIRICKGCQSVIYCSETCQLKHWTLKHKSECYQLKALRG